MKSHVEFTHTATGTHVHVKKRLGYRSNPKVVPSKRDDCVQSCSNVKFGLTVAEGALLLLRGLGKGREEQRNEEGRSPWHHVDRNQELRRVREDPRD